MGFPYPAPQVVAQSPSLPGTLFVGTTNSCSDIPCPPGTPPDGIYRSTDDGLTWQYLSGTSFPGGYIAKIAINPATPSLILAGYTLGYSLTNQYVFGIYLSRDGGTTWNAVLPQYWVTDIEYDPTNSSTVYAAGYATIPGTLTGQSAIYKSSDAGATWQQISNQWITSIAVDPVAPNLLYGVPGASTSPPFIYSSTDSGVTWSPLPVPSGMTITPTSLLISPANSNRIYAFGGIYNGIWRSDDAGQTWSNVTSNLQDAGIGPTVISGAIDPADNTTIWVGLQYLGIFASSDAGATWNDENNGISMNRVGSVGAWCPSFALSPDGQDAVVCSPDVFVRAPAYLSFFPVIGTEGALQEGSIGWRTRGRPAPAGNSGQRITSRPERRRSRSGVASFR